MQKEAVNPLPFTPSSMHEVKTDHGSKFYKDEDKAHDAAKKYAGVR